MISHTLSPASHHLHSRFCQTSIICSTKGDKCTRYANVCLLFSGAQRRERESHWDSDVVLLSFTSCPLFPTFLLRGNRTTQNC